MHIDDIKQMRDGWFIGNFVPSALRTAQCEVCYKTHKKGEKWPVHYHKQATEINYLVSGRMTIQKKILVGGAIFVIEPYEIADPVFHEDCTLVIVKIPSIPGDKYEL